MRPWLLAECSYKSFKDGPPFEVAVLPLGATEPHNLHLPYATDTLQVETIADLACGRAYEAGARVVALPALPFGTETNQRHFPFSMNLNPTTIKAVITDLVGSLADTGIKKCVILNGHGGNDLKWILRELHEKTPVHLFLCHWFRAAPDDQSAIFGDPGDHAGEMETSMILAHYPRLVTMDVADVGATAGSRFQAIHEGWVEITRPWHLLTTNSGAGDPRRATAEKGHAFTEAVVGRIASFLVDLSSSPLDAAFPFLPEEVAR